MKLHNSAVDRLVYLCSNHGGHAKENKLLDAFRHLRFSLYQHKGPDGEVGELFLVMTDQLIQMLRASGQAEPRVQALVLHATAIEELMQIYTMWDGYSNQLKLKKAFLALDLSPYERKLDNAGETVLVPTKIYQKVLVNQ
jgi:hypothetical protein